MLKRFFLSVALLLVCSGLVAAQSVPANTVNGSVVIAVGNTFQTILPALAAPVTRRTLTIQNNNASDSCWIVVGGALGSATKGIAISLPAATIYTRQFPYIPADAIHGTCATSASTLYIDTQ